VRPIDLIADPHALLSKLEAFAARSRATYRRLIVQPDSLAIALVGLFWTIQRVP
jgi:hypothetical protein